MKLNQQNLASQFLLVWGLLASSLTMNPLSLAFALPPPEDKPEEILRTEIITEARSPIDGKALSPGEYAELQAQLQSQPQGEALIAPRIKELLFLLRIRRAIRTIAPI